MSTIREIVKEHLVHLLDLNPGIGSGWGLHEYDALMPKGDKESLLKSFFAQAGYATPKVDVRGAVIQNNKILLVQERTDKLWSMPGGWADVGEAPSEMVVREVLEESGFKIIDSLVSIEPEIPTIVKAVLKDKNNEEPVDFNKPGEFTFDWGSTFISGDNSDSSLAFTVDKENPSVFSSPDVDEDTYHRSHLDSSAVQNAHQLHILRQYGSFFS